MSISEHLTKPNPELARLIEQTPAGMAHWAGTGPAGKACRDCQHFMGKIRRTGIGVGDMQPGRCRWFISAMKAALWRAVPVHRVPPDTPSCSHFVPKVVKARKDAS